MFERVLIANRGEIAVRIQRTLHRLGIESVAVFSDADEDAPHVRGAEMAVRIGPAPAAESYLNVERIVAAATTTGVQAVHPGYGFLSERADFARACEGAGLTFIGPTPEAIALLGDKAAAKQAAQDAGVPVVPGLSGERLSDDEITGWVEDQQLPVLLKAAGGGGGKGMRVVRSLQELPDALMAARREARSAFGDERLIVERYIERARHIEVQVIADAHGTALHLGERECSLQRRHQKVIEESPSPVVDEKLREQLGSAAVALAQACGYLGAGTVELIADREHPQSFYFLEMNARLQVEHPVTEAVTGLDLVELQLRIAATEPLGLSQQDVKLTGHAVEARIYAEDPANGFLPSTGRVGLYREPSELRFDSGIAAGSEIGTHYDPMLAKAIAHAGDRAAALRRLAGGLRQTRILGESDLATNLSWLLTLLDRPEVQTGKIDTTLLERIGPELAQPQQDRELAAGLAAVALLGPTCGGDPWDVRDGFSLSGRNEVFMRLACHSKESEVRLRPEGESAWRLGTAIVDTAGGLLRVNQSDGLARIVEAHRFDEGIWIVDEGQPSYFTKPQERSVHHAGTDSLQAPMPGVVLEVRTQQGNEVGEGDVLVVLESMKMELSVSSPEDGVVGAVHVSVGDRVTQGQALLEMEGA
ncbi:MAG TPA: biotin carboxylase N-terminal domain-containing protein [Solirubrobacteraceae bacterium]|jgi:acetyl-CoA/propionyl-CoA carboxylase biotin carboxyl carrier protein|nr:biotin carboxylase N-terminal domain-containing protein [Solirubrobacteraceae bacterium]